MQKLQIILLTLLCLVQTTHAKLNSEALNQLAQSKILVGQKEALQAAAPKIISRISQTVPNYINTIKANNLSAVYPSFEIAEPDAITSLFKGLNALYQADVRYNNEIAILQKCMISNIKVNNANQGQELLKFQEDVKLLTIEKLADIYMQGDKKLIAQRAMN